MQWTIYTDNPHVISCDWQKTWDCGNASDLRPSRSSQLQISFLNHLNFCAGNHLKLKLGHMSCLLHRACVELALWAFCFAPRLDSCALSIVYNVNLGASYITGLFPVLFNYLRTHFKPHMPVHWLFIFVCLSKYSSRVVCIQPYLETIMPLIEIVLENQKT